MPKHSLIIGMTGTGKSTLGKLILKEARKRDRQGSVLDSNNDPEWKRLGCFVTTDSAIYLNHIQTIKDNYLLIDEGGITVGRYGQAMNWVTSSSRHLGHVAFIASWSLTDLPTTLRKNCSDVYLFACASSNRQIVAEDWDCPEVMDLPRFQPGEFVLISRFKPPRMGKIIFAKTLDKTRLVWL